MGAATSLDLLAAVEGKLPSPQQNLLLEEELDLLAEALQRLPPRRERAVLLRYIDDLSGEDAAEPALPSTGLLSFYDRLRERILESVEERGGHLGSATVSALLLVPDVFMLLVRLSLDREVPARTPDDSGQPQSSQGGDAPGQGLSGGGAERRRGPERRLPGRGR